MKPQGGPAPPGRLFVLGDRGRRRSCGVSTVPSWSGPAPGLDETLAEAGLLRAREQHRPAAQAHGFREQRLRSGAKAEKPPAGRAPKPPPAGQAPVTRGPPARVLHAQQGDAAQAPDRPPARPGATLHPVPPQGAGTPRSNKSGTQATLLLSVLFQKPVTTHLISHILAPETE